ncbi:MAG: hypothetical protein COW65_15300 [Cytophagales bacterium CG18_big_fil_WC_8_21_14_2_50_42_9]|nr:MAG: hypothetical protein COW65_15300 [Cytophagales bacterium CG18_big_fil_WC_8_21_14_2_50_42_9]
MKKLFRKAIKPFLPTYEVICTNYQIVPGLPVNKNESQHAFEKGASQEANAFYTSVISSDLTKNMAPIEVHLKRRGKVIKTTEIGPVAELKNFRMAAHA